MKITSKILLLALLIVGCNNDDGENLELTKTELGYFPSTITLAYNDGQEVIYQLSYTKGNQIDQIHITRRSDDDIIYAESSFSYGTNGELTEVLSTFGVTEYSVAFTYDNDTLITKVDFIVDGIENAMDIFYIGEETNGYLINGALGNLPTAWDFDSENILQEFVVTSTNIVPTYSDFDKGVFKDVNIQPATHIWYGLVFYLSPWELYLFSQKDIKSLRIANDIYLYKNKLWNGEGNLVAFQYSPQIPFGFKIDYTITYETRTL